MQTTISNSFPSGIEAIVCNDILQRQLLGIKKYGTTVAENPLPLRDWLQHAYEETLDQAVYLRRAISEIDKNAEKEVPPTNLEELKKKIDELRAEFDKRDKAPNNGFNPYWPQHPNGWFGVNPPDGATLLNAIPPPVNLHSGVQWVPCGAHGGSMTTTLNATTPPTTHGYTTCGQ